MNMNRKSALFVKSLACIALLACAASPAVFAVSCKALPADRPPANDAEKALWNHDYGQAAKLYSEMYAAKPNDPELLEATVRAYLDAWNNTAADNLVSQTRAAQSTNSYLLTAASEVALRHGNIHAAEDAAVQAVQADPCNPRARWQVARILDMSSYHARALHQIEVAHQLDAGEPAITGFWLSLQPSSKVVAQIKSWSNAASADAKNSVGATPDEVAKLDVHAAAADHHCHLSSTVNHTSLPMTPHMSDGNNIESWAMMVGINDKSARLLIDTGASGILLDRVTAEKAGLKPVAKSSYFGVGSDTAKVGSSLAYADKVRIGDMEFSDCLVEISDRKNVMDYVGLISPNVFRDYLVTLDYPLHKINIGPLPTDPAAPAATSDAVTDSYFPPEMKKAGYSTVLLIGPTIFVPMRLNDHDEMMIMDTGATNTSFNAGVAPEFTKVKMDESYTGFVRGVGGAVQHVGMSGNVKMQFSNLTQYQDGALLFDMTRQSRAYGINTAGLLGASALYTLILDIDYRDGLVRFTYDRRHGDNAR
jgi:predicted aspartyl protease